VKEGWAGTFRARSALEARGSSAMVVGTKRQGGPKKKKALNKLALKKASYSGRCSKIKDGYPEFTLGVLKRLGWGTRDLFRFRDDGDQPASVKCETAGQIRLPSPGFGFDLFRRVYRALASFLRTAAVLRQWQGTHDRRKFCRIRSRLCIVTSLNEVIKRPRPAVLVEKYHRPGRPAFRGARTSGIHRSKKVPGCRQGIVVKKFPLI